MKRRVVPSSGHAHWQVDVSNGVRGPGMVNVELWTRDRTEVHEFLAEAREKGFTPNDRVIAVVCDWPADQCDCEPEQRTGYVK